MLDSQLGEEQTKKEFKIGFLFGDMRTQARGCIHRHYVCIRSCNLCMYEVKNRYMYARTCLRMHETWLRTHERKPRTQAQILVHINTYRESFLDIFKHVSIKTHPKHVPTPPKVSGFHLNRSCSET